MITQSESGWVYSMDLGNDFISLYKLDTERSQLIDMHRQVKEEPGSGPRQLIFHPCGEYAYGIHELNGTVVAFSMDKQSGSLVSIQSVSTLALGQTCECDAADIHISPNGKFLYASNRKEVNTIVRYRIDPSSGRLSVLGYTNCGGKTPRCFAIDPDGKFMVVALQDSNYLAIFHIDATTGNLTDTGKRIVVPSPTCVCFM